MSETRPAPKAFRASRRNLLLAGAGGVAAVGVGGLAWIGTADPKNLALSLLQRALPGITLDKPSSERFAADFMTQLDSTFEDRQSQRLQSEAKWKLTTALEGAVGADALSKMGPFGAQFEEITRQALTLFLMNSNFFYLKDPKSEPIVYERIPPGTPCANPWADVS